MTEKIYNTKIEIEFRILSMLSGYFLFWILCVKRFQLDFSIQVAEMQINLKWVFLIFIVIFLLVYLLANRKLKARAKWMILLGFGYISLSLGLMVDLRRLHILSDLMVWPFYPIVIIITIWINDTMAYLTGSVYGKTQLSKISPKKTWEGTLSGIILSVIIVALFIGFSVPEIYRPEIIGLPLVIAVAGTFGDLLESKLKRLAGVKDSGKLMPGHGGFLDRFDSMLLAIPAAWLYVYFFLN